MAAQQADSRQAESAAGCSQRMQMIGVWAAETDQPRRSDRTRCIEMLYQFEPLVAGQLGIQQIEPQHRNLDPAAREPVQ